MNRHDEISWEFAELIDRALDGTITAEQFASLDHQIAANENACIYYQEFITTYIGLMDLQGMLPKTFDIRWQEMLYEMKEKGVTSRAEGCHDLYNFEPGLTEEEKKRRIEIYASERLDEYLSEQYKDIMRQQSRRAGPDLWDAIGGAAKSLGAFFSTGSRIVKTTAVCLMTVLLFVLVFSHLYRTFVSREVATLDTSLDAAFADGQSVASGTRLTNRNEPFLLQKGLIEIVFDGSAKVLLEGPAAFQLKSPGRMSLNAGRLFATVTDDAKGFTVDTPNSRVIDLGTEFGVRVENDGTSDLHMFKGMAELAPSSGTRDKRILTVTAGQARRVGSSGQVRDIPITEDAFVRHFYSGTGFIWRGERLSLVDLAGHGNGLGTGRADIYMDPLEGYKESIYSYGKGNEYRTITSNLFIDGLFIPDGSSEQIVSSLGHQFVDCPKTNGECYASLGANPRQGVWATDMRTGRVRFDGQDYGDQEHPCFVMHANLGITFDLNAIRAMCPDIKILRFISKIGIADFEESSGCNADFWVLVDGQVRRSRRNLRQKNILSNVSVELRPSDRFLTLATTDGGDVDRMGPYQRSYTCDWCVFIEPELVLEKTEESIDIQKR